MRRRDFIAFVGSAAVAWPLAVRAQQAMPVIGFLHPASADVSEFQLRGFRQGLKEAGFVEGENVAIDYRWADNQIDQLPALAAELVRRRVAVVVTTGIGASAVKDKVIPVVFLTDEDPVKLGFVASLARPGGNLTGINAFLGEVWPKRLDLLRQLVPGVVRVAVLRSTTTSPSAESTLKDVEAAAGAMGLQTQVFNAETSSEIDTVFAQIGRERPDALFVGSGAFFNSRRVQLTQWAARLGIPATFGLRQFVEVGGLMSFGPNLVDSYRQAAIYAGRILKGEKPADLPVLQPTKFELIINHQTARILGLTVPPSLLAIADEVIE
jgi:putative tryptophan/tyrosine transport system substrate-binding protein